MSTIIGKLDYRNPPVREIGEKVYSTGFHPSHTPEEWIPVGAVGTVTQSRPCLVEFDYLRDDEDLAIEVAIFASDIAVTPMGAHAISARDRDNRRWIR